MSMQVTQRVCEADPLLHLEEGEVRYGDVPALRRVSLQLRRGELHVLLGPSGSGKTTLLRAVGGFESLRSGSLRLRGDVVDGLGADGRRVFVAPEARRIGFVFQDYALFPHLNVRENVAFGRKNLTEEEIRERLARAGLQGLEERYPGELSGGQQQRVALVRALAMAPELVCFDEPFSNVDRGLRRALREETRKMLRRAEVSSLLVTHDVDDAFALADRISVLAEGELLQSGPPQEVYDAPRTLRVAETLGDVELLAIASEEGGIARTAIGAVDVGGGEGTHLLLRPEDLRLRQPGGVDPGGRAAAGEAPPGSPAEVVEVRAQGATAEVWIALPDGSRVTLRTRWSERPQHGPCHVQPTRPLRRVVVDRALESSKMIRTTRPRTEPDSTR